MQREFAPKDPRSLMLRTHCQTSGVSLQAADPYNNVIRTTIEALAAVLGGTQSLHTNAFDEALALPTDFSARIARNTQLILAEETGIRHVVDPLGGSYYLEQLTASLARAAAELIDEVEALGGMTKAIEAGMPKARIEAAAAAVRRAGTGRGHGRGQRTAPTRTSRSSCWTSTPPRCARRRSSVSPRSGPARDEARCRAALEALRRGAAATPTCSRCRSRRRARATLGEISDAMEREFGRWRAEIRSISGVYGAAFREDKMFEAIQQEVEAFAEARGRRPRLRSPSSARTATIAAPR